MRIALLITGMGMGGAEKQVCDLSDRFTSFGHEVIIIYLTGDAVIKPKNPFIRLIGMRMSKNPLSFFKTFMDLRQYLIDFSPDVLHTHMIHANLMGRMLRLSMNIKRVITTAHSTNEGSALRMWLYRLTDSLCDISTNVSQKAVETFIARHAVPSERMITLYNGIDTNYFHFNPLARNSLRNENKIREDESVLLCVGRLHREKDYPTMLHAFALALEKNKNLILWIAGDGEEKESLLQICDNLNITPKVHFLGIRHDIPELMSACDLFCLSSRFEGFGLVVAEAMACERPIIATDCGGVKEIVGKDGILVSPSSPDQLANAIVDSLQLPFCSARQRIIETFSIDTIADQWINLYLNHKISGITS